MTVSVFSAQTGSDCDGRLDSGAPSLHRHLRIILALVRLDLILTMNRTYVLRVLLFIAVLMGMVMAGNAVSGIIGSFCADSAGSMAAGAVAGGGWVMMHMVIILRFTRKVFPGEEKLLASLPLHRSEVVAARYVEGLGCIAAVAVIGLVFILTDVAFGGSAGLMVGMRKALVMVISGLFLDLVVGLPLCIRFQTLRGWLCVGAASYAASVGVTILIGIIVKAGAHMRGPGPHDESSLFLAAVGVAALLGVLALVPSYRMSARFYARQDH